MAGKRSQLFGAVPLAPGNAALGAPLPQGFPVIPGGAAESAQAPHLPDRHSAFVRFAHCYLATRLLDFANTQAECSPVLKVLRTESSREASDLNLNIFTCEDPMKLVA